MLWLPPDAIRSAGGRMFVINTRGGPQRVDMEIVSGLEEGQVVVGPLFPFGMVSLMLSQRLRFWNAIHDRVAPLRLP